MRNLVLKDAFAVSRILKKMQIRPEVKEGTTQEQVGADLIFKFVENIGEAEEEVTALLADLKGVNPEELANMDFEEVANLIEDFKNLKGLQSFFQQVGKLMK
jgi:replication fork clamp-binding protein CrfC